MSRKGWSLPILSPFGEFKQVGSSLTYKCQTTVKVKNSKNTPAYYGKELIPYVKTFLAHAPEQTL